jgi:hypothetical protein
MANPRDDNRVPSIGTTSSVDGKTVHPATYTPIAGVDPINVAITNSLGSQINPSSLMDLKPYDYVAMVIAPAGTETWTFKTGGAGGTTTNTIVIVYTDSTRADISTVTKT